jgi:hypothetical protein
MRNLLDGLLNEGQPPSDARSKRRGSIPLVERDRKKQKQYQESGRGRSLGRAWLIDGNRPGIARFFMHLASFHCNTSRPTARLSWPAAVR